MKSSRPRRTVAPKEITIDGMHRVKPVVDAFVKLPPEEKLRIARQAGVKLVKIKPTRRSPSKRSAKR